MKHLFGESNNYLQTLQMLRSKFAIPFFYKQQQKINNKNDKNKTKKKYWTRIYMYMMIKIYHCSPQKEYMELVCYS